MAYIFSDDVLGNSTSITSITSTAPGVAGLPSVTYEPQLGEIRKAYDLTTASAAEFIYLKIPASSTFAVGNIVQWTGTDYAAALLPVLATSKNTLVPLAVCPVAVASSSTVQYGWFQIQGIASVLKTAVATTANTVIYASATAGRFKVLTSAGGQILFARVLETVTSTTSTALVYLHRPSMQGQIT
jgi:hypothetical protein